MDTPGEVTAFGNALPLVHEIATHLERFIRDGTPTAIDLRALPMGPGDHQHLRELLGEGEVRAQLDALGNSEIRETGVAGVWWITHRNASSEVIAELIEITDCPDILRTQHGDLQDALVTLRERLAASPHTTQGYDRDHRPAAPAQ